MKRFSVAGARDLERSEVTPDTKTISELLCHIDEAAGTEKQLLTEVKELEASILDVLTLARNQNAEEIDGDGDALLVQDAQRFDPVADLEDERFRAWLTVSDVIVKEHKDSSGWEEPNGVVQRVRERFSPLMYRGGN